MCIHRKTVLLFRGFFSFRVSIVDDHGGGNAGVARVSGTVESRQ